MYKRINELEKKSNENSTFKKILEKNREQEFNFYYCVFIYKMNKTTILVVLALIAVVICEDGLRLLKFSEDQESWHTMEEVVEFREKRVNFIDITHFRNPITTVPIPPPLPSQPEQKTLVNQLKSYISTSNMESNLEILSAYRTRYYSTTTGVQAASWIKQTLEALSSDRSDVTVSFFTSPDTDPQPSVIARIQGLESDDLVIIGCHEDSIHLGGMGVSPGGTFSSNY